MYVDEGRGVHVEVVLRQAIGQQLDDQREVVHEVVRGPAAHEASDCEPVQLLGREAAG